jgi:tetratricopeptide (TPR) repeat protein
MATGELPFGHDRDKAVVHAILHEPPRPAQDLPAGYPQEITGIIGRALAKDPARRYPSAREMAEALRDLRSRMSEREYATAGRLTFRRSRKRLIVGAAALSLAALAAAVLLLQKPGIAFESRDKLMVADAENLTGDKVFDLALRTAIEAGLQQSPYASVFDKPQIAETMRLMRMDPSARVDESSGYDICRFAGVRAFILPRILSAGDAYELEAILIDPLKKRHVDRFRVTAKGREEVLLKGIDKLTRQLRSRLGESLASIAKAEIPVAKYATSSWEALDYFSLAQAKRNQGLFKEAAALYELALEKDPGFVAARSSLALVQIQFLNQAEKGRAFLKQALADAISQGQPERDVLPLKAVNRQFVDGDLEGALSEYRTIMELFPDLMSPFNNAGRILQALGRFDEAADMYAKAAERAPKSSIPLVNAWYLHVNLRKDLKAAEKVARLQVDQAPSLANPHSLLGFTLAAEEKFDEGAVELRKALELEPDHPYALPNLAHVLYASGRAAEAAPLYQRVFDLAKRGKTGGTPEWDGIALALALRDSGRREEEAKVVAEVRSIVEKTLAGKPPGLDEWNLLAALDAIAGETDRAASSLDKYRMESVTDPNTLMDRAEVYGLLGRTEPAVDAAKKALASGYSDPFFPLILPELQSLRKVPAFRALFGLDK